MVHEKGKRLYNLNQRRANRRHRLRNLICLGMHRLVTSKLHWCPIPRVLAETTPHAVAPAILLDKVFASFSGTLLGQGPDALFRSPQNRCIWMAIVVAIAGVAFVPRDSVSKTWFGTTGFADDNVILSVLVDLARGAIGSEAVAETRVGFYFFPSS